MKGVEVMYFVKIAETWWRGC